MNKEGKKTNTLESTLSIDVVNKGDYAKQEEMDPEGQQK